ncbi:unnamed protein product [Dicrocoelium dendriticum]|nr:unnamed protein product [Dicrocoelium dendriticum]
MSYREMRTFTEAMRSLGFSRIISMENFRTPNFPLVAEILTWLVLRYDPNADIPKCLDTEQDRVIFIKVVVHFLATKACIRLNAKKLYQANGFAVKELLKVIKVLYSAFAKQQHKDVTENTELCTAELIDSSKRKELQEGRSLSSQLASSGASLHSLLGREAHLRELRNNAIGRQLDSTWVEQCVTAARDALQAQMERTKASIASLAEDEANLDSKIEKKQRELERNRKRLLTLQSVRPAYMEEYEQLEEELSSIYSSYITRFRNLAFLENQYEELIRASGLTQEYDMGDADKKQMEPAKQTMKSSGDEVDVRAHENDDSGRSVSAQYRMQKKEEPSKTIHIDGSQEDLIDVQDEDENLEDDDDDDDDDEDDEDDEDSAGNETINVGRYRRKSSPADSGIRVGRNQLSAGWSPSRQPITAANYHGRAQFGFTHELANSGVLGSGPTEEEKPGIKNVKGFVKDQVLRPSESLGSVNEDHLSNEEDVDDNDGEDEGDDDITDEINNAFGAQVTRYNVLEEQLRRDDSQLKKSSSKINSKSLSISKEADDDDF